MNRWSDDSGRRSTFRWRLLGPAFIVVILLRVGAFFLVKPRHHDSVSPLTQGTVVADAADEFQVMAPAAWRLETRATDPSGAFRLTAQDPADTTDSLQLEVEPEGDTGPFTRISDYYEGELRLISNAGDQLTTSVHTRYAGQDSYRFEYSSGSGISAKLIMETIFLHERKIFVVTYTVSASGADRNQMLAVLQSQKFAG